MFSSLAATPRSSGCRRPWRAPPPAAQGGWSGGAGGVRRPAPAAVRRSRDLGAKVVSTVLLGDGLSPKVSAQALAEGALLGTYTFDRYKREKNEKAVEELRVVDPQRRQEAAIKDGLRLGELFASAACFPRDLVNEPANQVTPTYLSKVAEEIAKDGRLRLKVYD